MASDASVHIFLVDDHRIVRLGFRRLLEQIDRFSVAGEAGSGEEAMEAIPQVAPDLVIVDVAMTGMDGIELTRRLKQRNPDLRVLVVSMHDELLYVEEALEVGADGYVLKNNIDEVMVEAVETVLRGQQYFCKDVRKTLPNC